MTDDGGRPRSPARASVPDTLRVLATGLLPVGRRRGPRPRRATTALRERVDADRRLVRTLQGLRSRYGPGPLRLRRPVDGVVLVLDGDDARHVLDACPEPFAPVTRTARGMAWGGPHDPPIADVDGRAERLRWDATVLDAGTPLHRLAGPMAAVVRHEARTLRTQAAAAGGSLEWPAFHAAWSRVVRRVVLGDGARDDTALAGLAGRAPADRAAALDRLRAHLERADDGSLAAVAAATPAGPHVDVVAELAACVRGVGAIGSSVFLALALLATHPRELAAARADIAPGPGEPAELSAVRAAVLEAMRLWPPVPALLRETTTETALGAARLPAGATVVLSSAFAHRDPEQHAWADDFTPRLWSGEPVPRAVLVPFGRGPAACPAQDLVLFLTSTFLAALLDGQDVRLLSRVAIRPGRPLPGTLDPAHLRFGLAPT